MSAIVLCFNGEPVERSGGRFWATFGPFDGKQHAYLWLKTIHCTQKLKDGKPGCFYEALENHWVSELGKI